MPPFNANQLRWLAESADGKRGCTDCVAVIGDDGKPTVVHRADAGMRPPLPIDVSTLWEPGGMRGGVTVTLSYGGRQVDVPDNTDAVFLTQTAVDKFVVPYYTRMEAPLWIQSKREELFGPKVVAALHAEPSITTGATARTIPLTFEDGQLRFNFDAI